MNDNCERCGRPGSMRTLMKGPNNDILFARVVACQPCLDILLRSIKDQDRKLKELRAQGLSGPEAKAVLNMQKSGEAPS